MSADTDTTDSDTTATKPTGLRSYRGGRPKGARNRPQPDMEPEWARVPETAGRFRISPTTLKRLIKDREVNSRKLGNIRLVEVASVRRRIEAGEA